MRSEIRVESVFVCGVRCGSKLCFILHKKSHLLEKTVLPPRNCLGTFDKRQARVHMSLLSPGEVGSRGACLPAGRSRRSPVATGVRISLLLGPVGACVDAPPLLVCSPVRGTGDAPASGRRERCCCDRSYLSTSFCVALTSCRRSLSPVRIEWPGAQSVSHM